MECSHTCHCIHVMVRGHLRELVLFQDVSSKDPIRLPDLATNILTCQDISLPFILICMLIFVSVFGLVLLGIKARTIDLHL